MTAKTNAPGAGVSLQSDRAPDGSSAANRFRKLVGYTTRAWSDNYGEVELAVDERHANSLGIVHGGVFVTLLDAAMGHAVGFCRVPGNVRSAVTVSLTTTFLAQAKDGRLIARGRVVGVSGRIATVSGEVVDEGGQICCTGQGSFMYLPGSEHPDGVPRKKTVEGQ